MNLFHISGLLLDEGAADDHANSEHGFGRRYGSGPANAQWLGNRQTTDRSSTTPCCAAAAAAHRPA
jgi:hypothetical protein